MAISNETFEYYRLIQKAKQLKDEKKEVQTVQKQPRQKPKKS